MRGVLPPKKIEFGKKLRDWGGKYCIISKHIDKQTGYIYILLYLQACHVRLTYMSEDCKQLKKQSEELRRQLGRSEIETDQRKRVEASERATGEELFRVIV